MSLESATLIRNAQVINEQSIQTRDILFKNGRIERMDNGFDVKYRYREIAADGLHIMPGIIDDQVHFREPGLTNKGEIYTESRAAAAGGVTSFMDMPNVVPPSLTLDALEARYTRAAEASPINYSFYMGTSNTNITELRRVDPKTICGIKIFMGSSTGDLAITSEEALERIFSESPTLIATHCEDDNRIKERTEKYKREYGDAIPIALHPDIRDEQACIMSSEKAIALAKKHNTRLHILHISTAEETHLFDNTIPLAQKKITAEACVHHLWFDSSDYATLDSQIKCNPAIKDARHKPEILKALIDNRIDVIATDHAPHTWAEKHTLTEDGKLNYTKCPSGLPLVQHSLNIMLMLYHQGKITLEDVVQKMCHNVATCFHINDRGYLREGFYADAVLVDINKEWKLNKESLLYKCGWSPLEGQSMKGRVIKTFVNGGCVWENDSIQNIQTGMRLAFDR